VRLSFGWRGVLSAWALLLILILAGFGVMGLASPSDVAQASPALSNPGLRGVRIPQFDPFDLGPPPFNQEGDFDSEAHLMK
jgi:hypothetical protein